MAEGTPSKSAQGRITWIHTDTRGIQAATAAAYARAVQGHWTNDDESVRDQRALVLYAIMSSTALSPVPPLLEQGVVAVRTGTRASSTVDQDWQTTLIWGVVYLLGVTAADVQAGRMNLTARVRVETEDGGLPAGPTPDTGIGFIALAAIVYATTALAGVIALWLSQRNEIDANKIASDERVQKHAAALAEASSVVDAHVQAEKDAGQTLAWNTEQLKYLEELKGSIRELSKTPNEPLKSVPDMSAVSRAVAGAVTDVGSGVKSAGTAAGAGFGGIAALAILYFLWKENEHGGRERAAA